MSFIISSQEEYDNIPDEFDERVELFRDYLATMEDFLAEKLRSIGEQQTASIRSVQEAITDGVAQEDDYGAVMTYFQEYSDWVSEFGSNLRRGHFLNLMALLLSELKDICEQYQLMKHLSRKLTDIAKGSELEKIQKYLKSANVYFPDETKEWEGILGYYKLRNCLLHSGGSVSHYLSGGESRSVKFWSENFLIQLVDHGLVRLVGTERVILIQRGLCEEVLDTIHYFVRQIGTRDGSKDL